MDLAELQRYAMELPDSERATLAAELLGSLPVLLLDGDDGFAEAERRSKELDRDPSKGLSWDEMKRTIGR